MDGLSKFDFKVLSLAIFAVSTLMLFGTAQYASAGADISPSFLFEFGSGGSGDGQFEEVRGVAVDSSNGHIIVADRNNDRIQVFNSAGAFLFEFDGSAGDNDCSAFDEPKAVAVDGAGNIYVADFDNDLIQKFDSTGACLDSFDVGGEDFSCPRGVAVASSGNIIVLDECNAEVDVYNAAGTPLFSFDGTTGDAEEFGEPKAVAVDSSGKIYVPDRTRDNVQIFDSDGNFLSKFGSSGSGDGQFDEPNGIAVGSTGIIYVTDLENDRIQLFDSSGNFLAEIGSFGSGDGEFNKLRDVAVDTSGRFYVADDGSHFRDIDDNNRIQVFDSGVTEFSEMFMFDSGDLVNKASAVTYLQGPTDMPFPNAITQTDCDDASSGPQAFFPILHPSWDTTLEAEPTAEWISSDNWASPVDPAGPFHSSLFAHEFFIGPVTGAELDFSFMMDNELGGGPNQGLFINCKPIPGTVVQEPPVLWSGPDIVLGQLDITSLLVPNSVNTLFIVSNNVPGPGGNPSGTIYKAKISLNVCGPDEEFVPVEDNGFSASQIGEDGKPLAGECVGTSTTSGTSGHEPPTIGRSLDGVRQVVDGGMSVDDQTWTVTQGYHQEFELLQMLTSPHTISNVIHCAKGVQYCNYIAVGFMGLTDDFNNPVMTVSASKDHLGDWTIDWYDPDDYISDPGDAAPADIVFVPQIIDNKLLGTSFTIDFKNKDTGQLKMGIQVRDSYGGVRNFFFNEGVEFIDADAYPAVETAYESPVEVEPLCFGQNNPDRNSCQFSKMKDWATQNAEETLRQMMGNQYEYEQ